MGKAIEAGPAISEESKYTAETWAPYAAALEAAEALKDVRIYDAEGVEAVKKATADLIAATQALEAKPDVPPAGKYVLASSIEPGKTYVIVADEQFALNTTVVDYGSYSSAGGTLGSTAVTVEGDAITSEVTEDMLWTINEATGVQAAVDGAAQYFIFAQDGRQLLRRSGSTSTAPLSLGEMNPSSQQYATWSFYQGAEPPRKSVSDEASFTMYVNSYRDNDYPFTMTGSAEGFNCPGVTRANWDPDTYEVEDSAMGFIKMKNGATIVLEAAWAINLLDSREASTTLCGTKAGAEIHSGMSYPSNELIYNRSRNGQLMEEHISGSGSIAYFEGGSSAPGVVDNRQWLEAIKKGTSPLVKPEQALAVTRVLDAIYKAAETNKEVRF